MINIAICDDNTATLETLKDIIDKEFSEFTADHKISAFGSGTLLINAHNHEPFDILFLDIDMPKVTGFDIAKILRDDFSNCFIIFVSSHSELIYESMDFQPFHFIKKDCGESLNVSVNRIIKKLMKHMKQNDKIILEDERSDRLAVYIHNIIYLESDRHYVKYYIKDLPQPIRVRENISECEEKYAGYDFVRIHKRYIINLRYLSHFDNRNNEVTLASVNRRLEMSKNCKKDVDEKYTLYLRSKL
ncbi:MAG: LytTR family DNA-binding domain-containing protein [Ruminococcus sp.]|nr:LytTR family DNA-binding domain-containing protein [Ruminococcus sp.]